MNQLFKIMLIASFNIFKICAAADDQSIVLKNHASRVNLLAAIWDTPEGKVHAEELCDILMVKASCDCMASLCEVTVLATHIRALILIGVDYETGKHLIDSKSVSWENKQQAFRMLLKVEASDDPRVLNAIAGLLREGANQIDGNATAEDLKKLESFI